MLWTPSDPDLTMKAKRVSGASESPRDWAPFWQRDMPADWWLVDTGGRLRIWRSLLDRLGGSLEGSSGLLFRSCTLFNICWYSAGATCQSGRGYRQ
jgi:hypothetical protein